MPAQRDSRQRPRTLVIAGRMALAGALLLAVLLALPSTASSQSPPDVTVSFGSATYTVAEWDNPATTNTEENKVTVTVTLSADPERTVVIPITATQQGATFDDYSILPTNLTFNSGETLKSFTFRAAADAGTESGESVKLSFGTLPTGVTATTPAETTVSITDAAPRTVTFRRSYKNVAEGGEVIFVLERWTDGARNELIVPITATYRGGATADDFADLPSSVTIGAGAANKSFSFRAVSDSEDPGESVQLSLGPLPDGYVTLPHRSTAVATISDGGEITVRFEELLYFAKEGVRRGIRVLLSALPGREITVPITVTHRGGATAADYSGVPSSITFRSNERARTIDFRATADGEDDGESVVLGFGAQMPAGVSAGRDATAMVRLEDDGEVRLGLAQVGIAVSAAFRDRDRFLVDRTTSNEVWQWQRSATETGTYVDIPAAEGGTSNPYTPTEDDLGMWLKAKVTYDAGSVTGKTAQGTVLQPVLARPVVSNAGHASHVFTGFLTHQPTPYEFAQGFTTGSDTRGYRLTGVRLALFFGAIPGSEFAGTWAVHADDGGKPAASPLAAALPILDSDLDHSQETFLELTLPEGLLLEPNTRYWIVTSRSSYWASGYLGLGALVSGSFGDAPPAVHGPERPYADSGSRDGWSIDLEALAYFYNVEDESSVGNPIPVLHPWTDLLEQLELDYSDQMVLRMAVVVVPDVKVQFDADSYTVDEGGTGEVTVKLSADPQRTLTIPITATNNGGATIADYDVPASVTFNAGERSKTITFTATQDTLDDDDESVTLALGTMPDVWARSGDTDETTISIADDDDPEVTVEFGASTYTVAESDDPNTTPAEEHKVTVTVTLSADPERTVVIPITKTNQGGATDADYSGVPASVTFASGETSKTFTFTATSDTVDDDDESVLLAFGTLPARVTAGTTAATTVSITDDDDPEVTVSFGASTYTVAESDDPNTSPAEEHKVTVTLTLSADPERTVIIPITTTNQGGASSADYSGVPASVSFDSGETSKTFTFTATSDTVDDDDESVLLTFGTLPARVSAGTTAATTISITDDDDPEVTVSFAASTYTVAESDDPNTTPAEEHKVTVTVTLNADPERTVVIPITKTNQGGASDADYSGVPASATFASGETSKTFTFTATPDTVDDDGESVLLTFGTLPARVSAGTTAATTVSITDDDDPEVTVTFAASTYTVAESDDPNTTPAEEHKVTVTLTLNADPERSVVIPITKTNQGGASDADYSGVPASVTFASGETSKTFTFTAASDTVDDDDESVKLAFGALPARVSAGTTAETVISITDDDDPEVTVTFAASAYYVAESDDADTTNLEENKVTVTLTLSADPERSVTIPITKTNQGGASDADYSGVPAGVTFASGETSKSFTFTAAEDTVDDQGESVKLSFGTLPSRVTAGSRAETTIFITDECAQHDIWCAEVEFGRLYETELERDAVDRGSFESNNVVYRVSTIWVRDVYDPDDIQPPFRIPERTKLIFTLEVVGGNCVPLAEVPGVGSPPCNWIALPNDDALDWTLHVTTVKDGETLAAALPFSEARGGGTTPRWNWYGRDIENLRLAWSDGQAYRFRIVRDLRSGRTPQAPGPPLYLRVKPVPYDGLWLYWVVPQQRDDSSPQDVTYKVQWKLSTGSWETPADVSEQTRGASVNFGIVEVIEDEVLAGLTAGSEYHFRVLATNAAGDGPPSNVITHTTPAAQQSPGNDPPTGAPAITGTAQVGETLSATTATIEDADGLEGATFAYEWLRSGVAIEGATGQSYTVVEEDAGSRLYVRVTFTDDGGNEESLTSEPTETVVFPPLRLESATVEGADLELTYSHPLNATTELLESAFTVTVGGTAVTVSEASASGSVVSLVLASAVAAADTVTVGYAKPETDNRNHVITDVMGRPAQNFSGRAVTNDTAAAGLTASVRNVPDAHDGSASFTFELHFSEAPSLSYATLRNHAFTVTDGSVQSVRRLTPGSNLAWEITVAPSGSGAVTLTLPATTDCEDEGAICTGDGKQLSSALRVSVPGPASGQALQQSAQENRPATGAPAIGGTAQVGETLTASTTGITDADGLGNATFTYAWLADGVAIAGATGSSYTLTAAEEGKAITVVVTFTDDAGNAESLTSAATSAVAPAPLTAEVREAPESHDGSGAFTFELHFSEAPSLSFVALRDHAFSVTGGSIEQAPRLTQGSNQGWEITVRPSGSGAVTLTLPVTTDCEDEGAVCTAGGKMLSERLETVIPGP